MIINFHRSGLTHDARRTSYHAWRTTRSSSEGPFHGNVLLPLVATWFTALVIRVQWMFHRRKRHDSERWVFEEGQAGAGAQCLVRWSLHANHRFVNRRNECFDV